MSISRIRDYAVSFEAHPYLYATAGCPSSITCTDASWSAGWTVLHALQYPSGAIETSVDPAGGELTVSDLTLVLFDVTIPTGPQAGKGAVRYYATRFPSRIPAVGIGTAITSISTTFTISALGTLDTGGGIAWVDAEAIEYGAHATTTVPIATRGVFGSMMVDHIPSNGRFPEAWTEFPGFDRRRMVLWKIEDGVATALWRGYCEDGPESDETGSTWTVRGRHIWTRLRERKLGFSEAFVGVSGYDNLSVQIGVKGGVDSPHFWSYRAGRSVLKVAASHEALQSMLQQDIESAIGTTILGGSADRINVTVHIERNLLTIQATFKGLYTDGAAVAASIGGERTDWSAATARTGGDFVAKIEVQLPAACRGLFVGTPPSAADRSIRVDSTAGLPSTWTEVKTTTNGYVTEVKPVLRAPFGNDAFIVVEAATTTEDPPTLEDCTVTIKPRSVLPMTREQLGIRTLRNGFNEFSVIYLTEPTSLVLTYRVRSQHWIYAIRYAVWGDTTFDSQTPATPPDYLLSGGRADDWDWSGCDEIVAVNAGVAGAREWYFDGSQTAGGFMMDLLRFGGCILTTRAHGRLAPWPLRPPIPTDTMSAEFTNFKMERQYAPKSQRLRNALSNIATLEVEDGKMTVVDARSIQRYGQARTVELRLPGVSGFAALATSISTLATHILGRALWVEPVNVHRMKFPPEQQQQFYVGDFVRITSHWALPDGRGERGYTLSSTDQLATSRGMMQVLTSRFELSGTGTVEIAALQWQLEGFAGYSPACRLESISGAWLYCDRSFLTAATTVKNYAGADPVTGDAGVSKFKVGMKVKLRQLDSTAPAVEGGFEVAVIDAPNAAIKLTVNVPTSPTNWASMLTFNNWVDVVFDDAGASITDAQRGYAWIGGPDTITGTGDETTRWSP